MTCKLAQTPAELDEVFRIRHLCYHRSGAIEPRPDGRFSDRYDELPNSFSFLMQEQNHGSVATVRITVVRPNIGWNTAPAHTVFGDHPAFQRAAREPFVEASRLCFVDQARRDELFRLVANMAAMADSFGAQRLIACPRAEHSGMYERLFGFRRIAEPRRYFGVNFETSLLEIPLDALRRRSRTVKSMHHAWNCARSTVLSMALRPAALLSC